ncbi:hypothetical protein ACOME3_009213 [Neoechinorhynchus agilis]
MKFDAMSLWIDHFQCHDLLFIHFNGFLCDSKLLIVVEPSNSISFGRTHKMLLLLAVRDENFESPFITPPGLSQFQSKRVADPLTRFLFFSIVGNLLYQPIPHQGLTSRYCAVTTSF